MDRRLTFPAFGALAIVAGASGVYLGQSAVDQINPLYFQGAAVHPRDRGAAVEETLLARGPRFADHYGWEEGRAARTADCNGCEAVAARDAYSGGRHFAVIESGWQAQPAAYYVAERQAPAVAAEEQQEVAAAEPAAVERYAAFQIEEKPVEPAPAETEVAAEQ
jgi:hypothetical protein